LQRQSQALVGLAKRRVTESGELPHVVREITEVATRTLGIGRASVWLYSGQRDALRCVGLHEVDAARHSDGMVLEETAYPAYFAALREERILAAHDAHADPRTAEFSSGYLTPLGIGAMVDAPIRVGGEVVGVVCHEHLGGPRTWTADEQSFTAALADLVALAISSADRRRAETALRRSEEQFRAMIENAADLIMMLDGVCTIGYTSPSITRMLGYGPDELAGTIGFDLVHPDDLPHVLDAFARSVAQPHEAILVEYRFRHADGSWRALETRGTNLLDHPAVASVVVNSRDVTERNAAAATLVRRTAELERSNGELEQFAYVASHDLQEPLRKIQAFGGRLRARCADSLGPQGLDYLERMEGAAERMQALIGDLLAFSRVTSKARPYAAVHLGDVARAVLADLQVRVETSGGRVELGELPTIEADPTQMRQLLQNLIGNALKFRRPGVAPVVTIAAAVPEGGARGAPAAGGPLVELRVADNGIGFDEKYLDRIFTPFQRLHGRGEYEGTGMGLAICRKIAERHGGSITARSAVNEGTTFVVTLPVHHPNIESTS